MLQQEMNHIFRMWMCFQIIILKYVKIYNPKSTQNVLNAFLLILQNCIPVVSCGQKHIMARIFEMIHAGFSGYKCSIILLYCLFCCFKTPSPSNHHPRNPSSRHYSRHNNTLELLLWITCIHSMKMCKMGWTEWMVKRASHQIDSS